MKKGIKKEFEIVAVTVDEKRKLLAKIELKKTNIMGNLKRCQSLQA